MTAAVLYARFSPRPGNKSMSAEAQLMQCRNYCKFHQFEVIDEFKDEAISGKSTENRPGFLEAMELACRNKAVFVVYSLSRFARSTKDTIIFSEQLDKSKADLASLKEQIDTTSPVGRFTFRLLAALAELEREQTAERTRDAMLYYQSQNRRMSNLPPFGWRVCPDDNAKIEEDEAEQLIIERIIDLRRQGNTLRKISDLLWREGIYGRRNPVYEVVDIKKWGRKPKPFKTDKVIAWSLGRVGFTVVRNVLRRAGIK